MMKHNTTMTKTNNALRANILLVALAQLVKNMLTIDAGFAFVFDKNVRVHDALDVRPIPTTVVMLAITTDLALQFPLSKLTNLLKRIDPSFKIDETAEEALRQMIRMRSMHDAIMIPLAIITIPTMTKKLLFHDLLLPNLARQYNATTKLALSSMLFKLVHAMPIAIVYAAIANTVLDLVQMQTHSMLPCITMHNAFNAVPMLLPTELVRIEDFNTTNNDMYHLPLPLTIKNTLMAALAIMTMTRLTKTDRA